MWRLRRVFVPVAAVGAALALAACGGDSSPETPIVVPTSTQPSQGKTDFVAQADSICAEANSSIEQFAASGQGLTEADQIAQLRQGVVDQIKQLNPPSDPNLDAFLKAMTRPGHRRQEDQPGAAARRGHDRVRDRARQRQVPGRDRRLLLRLQGVRRTDHLIRDQLQQLRAAPAPPAAAAPSHRARPAPRPARAAGRPAGPVAARGSAPPSIGQRHLRLRHGRHGGSNSGGVGPG